MTHSAHRMGRPDDLKRDYHLLAMASVNADHTGVVSRLREFLCIARGAGAVNLGVGARGSLFSLSIDELVHAITARSVVHATFDGEEPLCHAMAEVKKADLGISVTAQGLFKDIERCCQKTDLSFHTVAFSMGLFGPKELIPQPEVLELSTMCGHGFVTFTLAQKALEDVESGRKEVDEACRELARPCLCGLFNPIRAREIFLKKKRR